MQPQGPQAQAQARVKLSDCDCHFEHLLESQLTMVALLLPSRVGESEERNAGCVYSPA